MDAEEWIESLVRGFMCLSGIIGNNWLGFRSLPISKSLRTSDALFINLALSNLITNYMVDLPDAMADFADHWFMGELYCGVFRFCSDLSETSSIFTTLFISVFWYQKLVGSLKRGGGPVQMDNLRLVATLLAGSWTVAVAFSLPHFFFVSMNRGNNSAQEDCVDHYPSLAARQTYETIYLSLANALPVAGIVFASVRIVVALLEKQKRVKSLTSEHSEGAAKTLPDKDKKGATALCDVGNSKILLKEADAAEAPECSSKGKDIQANVQPKQPDSPCQDAGSSVHSPVTPNHLQGAPKLQARPSPTSGSQVRAAKSVVAVASVFLVCWLTHLLLRITSNVNKSSLVVEIGSYLAASYTCIIPYIFLHGVKKLSCSCRG